MSRPSPASSLLTILPATLLACSSGGGTTPAPTYGDSCTWSSDGACDEPWRCGVGTDSTDCAAACMHGDLPPDQPACLYRAPAPGPRVVPPENGSRGNGGPTGTWDGTLRARGQTPSTLVDRFFRVHVPASYDPSKPTPIVYMLAGFTVDIYGLESYTELNRTADLDGFIVVYPQAPYRYYGAQIGWVFVWNIYPSDWSPSTWDENPDLDFIRVLSAKMKSLYNIDRTRIITTGHSRGAALSIILAFTAPDLISGFCSEMGFIKPEGFDAYIQSYTGERKVPGVLVHGTGDPDVNIGLGSDNISTVLTASGWVRDQDYLYFRLPRVTHQWQPQYNQQFYDFLWAHPLPLDQVAP
jgi:predicted esterase